MTDFESEALIFLSVIWEYWYVSNFNVMDQSAIQKHTVDRVRGVKGSKVLRTRKIKTRIGIELYWYNYFCSNSCYNDYFQ